MFFGDRFSYDLYFFDSYRSLPCSPFPIFVFFVPAICPIPVTLFSRISLSFNLGIGRYSTPFVGLVLDEFVECTAGVFLRGFLLFHSFLTYLMAFSGFNRVYFHFHSGFVRGFLLWVGGAVRDLFLSISLYYIDFP